jgi:hypothetical protein
MRLLSKDYLPIRRKGDSGLLNELGYLIPQEDKDHPAESDDIFAELFPKPDNKGERYVPDLLQGLHGSIKPYSPTSALIYRG